MGTTVRWGILGCGKIAVKFAEGIRDSPDSTLVACGSRSLEKAQEFAATHGVKHPHGSYRDLVGDDEVDAIYVATPHPMHREHTMLALEAGKAVLCEKPFAVNAGEARDMVKAARTNGCFLMEAMWSRFLPSVIHARNLVADGTLGTLRMLQADFGFRAEVDPKSRLFDPNLGGGALLDVGIYPISLASFLFGEQPSRIASLAEIGETGVDEQGGILFGYPNGSLALLATGVRTTTPHEATIIGTKGYLRLHGPWWRGAAGMTLHLAGAEPESIEAPVRGNGYNYEADEVCRCLNANLLESEHMSLSESVAIVETLDTIREQWKLRYPMEEQR